MLKIAIVEDEKITAMDLADTLRRVDSDIEIVAILASVKQGMEFFEARPNIDLVFSDIQLPDGLSFEIYKQHRLTTPVIFCTAYDQYALQAFNANGIDYLLKPFSKETVAKALDKYEQLRQSFAAPTDKLNTLIQLFDSYGRMEQPIIPRISSVVVYQGEKIIPIEIQAIALFFLEDGYVFALTFELKKHIVAQTLEELETRCGRQFFRANRQYLVNRKAVKDAARYLNRKILVHLTIAYPQQILVGKLKTSQLLEWLANT